ncbi:MAG: FKBP-type peptidyl-prolyl cis-trans isomerase [Bdellovibrionota bacterium]
MLKTAILSIFCLALVGAPAFAKSKKAKHEKAATKKEEKVAKGEKKMPDGLVIEDEKNGAGKEAQLGSKITVHYRGTLENGKEFDSSYKAGQPITFDLLEGRLIKGWTEGIPGMKVGGKRKLKIPYQLAYGESGTPDGTIPPKSNLNFEVELIDVK